MQQVRQGDPRAIEALLREQLRRQGVRVQVAREAKQLSIRFTGQAAPEKRALLMLVSRTLRHVSPQNIHVAKVLAYQQGDREAVWTGRILLNRSLGRPRTLGRWLATARGKAIATLGLFVFFGLSWGLVSRLFAADPVAQAPATIQPPPADSAPTPAPPADDLIRIAGLPPHRLREQEIFDGKRLQIDTDQDISRDECSALAAQYLDAAGIDGQVVVQKPNPKSPWNGKNAPYCANNLDAVGTFFNDEYFDDVP